MNQIILPVLNSLQDPHRPVQCEEAGVLWPRRPLCCAAAVAKPGPATALSPAHLKGGTMSFFCFGILKFEWLNDWLLYLISGWPTKPNREKLSIPGSSSFIFGISSEAE